MTKILNLDALGEQEQRELVLGGKTYKVPAMTVANFIETSRIAQKLVANQEATVADHVEAAVDMIVRSIPDAPKKLLMGCSVETLNKITAFIKGEDDEKVEQAVEQQKEQAAAADAEQPSGN
jgi:hypothetical protein